MKISLILCLALLIQACVSGHCRYIREAEAAKKANEMGPPVELAPEPNIRIKSGSADRVRIYKFDGSLQCGLGQSKSLSENKKELLGIEIHNNWKRHDGLMRIQLCGSPTGQSNVYEIDRKDLEAALKLGFKEWTLD